MFKRTPIILLILTVFLFLSCGHASNAQKYAKRYLEIVYPTSTTIKNMSAQQAYHYYSQLNYWYRVPLKGFPNGIFNPLLKPQFNVFLFPDTSMRIDTAKDALVVKSGFITKHVIQGSNKNYIEVSSLGWMMYPYGGYFNWSRGSGIYLYTGGKTIAGYNKIDILYKVYKKQNKLQEFDQKLGDNSTVKTQIIGKNTVFTQQMYRLLINKSFQPKQWKYIPYSDGNNYNPLIVCLFYSPHWSQIQSHLLKLNSPEKAYQYLVSIYIDDHIHAHYDKINQRYTYLRDEANANLDKWMYDAVKAAGINVIQMTLEPNSAGSPTFEICDVRWPEVSFKNVKPAVLGEEAIEGLQSYNLMYVWNKIITKGWLTIRDPFDLENNSKAKPINISYPSASKINPALITQPPKDFPLSWLPQMGWGLKQAQESTYIKTDRFLDWIKPHTCPAPLYIKSINNACHLISFGLNNVKNNGFSPTNIEHNIKIFKQSK